MQGSTSGFQRVRVEFRRPYRGSDFTWTYESDKESKRQASGGAQRKPGPKKGRRDAEPSFKDFFSFFEEAWNNARPRAEVRSMRSHKEGWKGARRDRPRHQCKRYR